MLQNLLLMIMAFVSMWIGVTFPNFAGFFLPMALPGMMIILFLTFLSVEFSSLYLLSRSAFLELTFWTLSKLILVPFLMWLLARWLIADWATAILVLCASPTAAIAPFFASQLRGDVVLAIQTVVTTSVFVPLVLPTIINLLIGQETQIAFTAMARLLALLVFLPLLASLSASRFTPRLARALYQRRFIITTFVTCAVMMGIFAKYSEFILSEKEEVAIAFVIVSSLTAASLFLGLLLGKLTRRRHESVTGMILTAYANGLIAIALGSQFFGARVSLLASLQPLPLFLALIPLEWLSHRGPIRTKAK